MEKIKILVVEDESILALGLKKKLENLQGFHIPVISAWAKSVMWMFNAYLSSEFGISRDQLMDELKNNGIETREAFVPINKQNVFLERGLVHEDDCPSLVRSIASPA